MGPTFILRLNNLILFISDTDLDYHIRVKCQRTVCLKDFRFNAMLYQICIFEGNDCIHK